MIFDRYRVSSGHDGQPLESDRSAVGVVTFKAEDIESRETVLLKVIPWAAFNSDVMERLKRQVDQARVLQHPNIARVLHFGSSDDQFVYAQEYFEGETLASWVKEHGPMPVDAALRIALQVAQALSVAAFHLSPHRAIGPRNLVLVSGQTAGGDWPFVKLINFGLAEIEFGQGEKPNGRSLENDASIFYRSPEQAQHRAVDIRSDIYSLGCTLWFLLVGAPPFLGEGTSVLAPAVITEPPVEQLRCLPKPMRSLLAYMLRRDPEERPLDPVTLTQIIERSLARVERRQTIARRLGMPFLGPIYVHKIKVADPEEKRPVRGWIARTAAAAAVVISLAALVAAFGTWQLGTNSIFSSSSREKPIGVPVGVPEPSVAAPIANNQVANIHPARAPFQTAPPSEAQTSPQQASIPDPAASVHATPATAVASRQPGAIQNAGVQKSDAKAGPQQPLPSDASSSTTNAASRALASGDPAGRQIANGPNQEIIPAPPTKGPDENTVANAAPASAAAPSRKIENESSPEDVGAKSEKSGQDDSAAAKHRTQTRRIASHFRKKLHEVRRALPPESQEIVSTRSARLVRARFLGTTADGNWILGVPGLAATMVVPPPPPGASQSVLARGVRIALPPDW